MSWHINLEKNTVKITSEIALALYQSDADVVSAWQDECEWPMLDGIISGNEKLVFNSDHMEHMDYVSDERIQEILKRFKVKGDICFSSNEGDNNGQKWGYRFDGKGGMVELTQDEVGWREVMVGPKRLHDRKKIKKPTKTSKKKDNWRDEVIGTIEYEGFDYCFRYYSTYREIKDKKFHRLRKAYVKAAKELEQYVNPGAE